MAGTWIPAVPAQFFTDTGAVAAGHLLFTYAAGTTTKLATYSDYLLATPNANPIVLDSAGRATIFLDAASYKFVLAPPTDTDPPTSPLWTRDKIPATSAFATSIDIQGTAGETISTASGTKCIYLSDGSGGLTAGRWYNGDSTNPYSSSAAKAIGFYLSPTGTTVGQTINVRLVGSVDGYAGTLTVGTAYYIGATGAITSTPPVNARALGVADTVSSLVVPPPAPFLGTLLKGFAFSSGQSGSAVAGVDFQLTSYDVTIPANYLNQPGDSLVVEGTFSLANSANAKLAKLQIASGTANAIFNTSAAVANHVVPFRMVIRRRTSTTGSISGVAYQGAASGGTPTNYMLNANIATVDWTIAQTLKVIVNGATATNEITLTDYSVNAMRGVLGATV